MVYNEIMFCKKKKNFQHLSQLQIGDTNNNYMSYFYFL